jgi:trimethylamine-N-oxide reductase (cytochrome c)
LRQVDPQKVSRFGLKDGDVMRVFNDRGHLLADLKITEGIRPGVIRINEGGRFDPLNPREIGSFSCATARSTAAW